MSKIICSISSELSCVAAKTNEKEINMDMATSVTKIMKDKATASQPRAAAFVPIIFKKLLFLFK